MSIKIPRSMLEKLIKEELANFIQEADEDNKEKDKPESKPQDKKSEKKPSDKKLDKSKDDVGTTKPTPIDDDPNDDELAANVSGKPEKQNKLSSQLAGKMIQSITMEEESKTMPGFKEVDVQFEGKNPPLKIFIGKSGVVKFLYNGALHNSL